MFFLFIFFLGLQLWPTRFDALRPSDPQHSMNTFVYRSHVHIFEWEAMILGLLRWGLALFPFVKVFHAPENWWIIYPPPIPEFPGCCGRSSFASFSSSFPLFDYLVFYFFPFFFNFFFFFFVFFIIIMTAQRRPEVFSFFSFCLGLDGRRRAPKPCFISFRVKRKITKNKTKKRRKGEPLCWI